MKEQVSEFDQFETVLQHRYPNCMAWENKNRLLIGDSLGGLHIYVIKLRDSSETLSVELNRVHLLQVTNNQEGINNIVTYNLEIYVSCRDDTVKRIILDKHNRNHFKVYQQYYSQIKQQNIFCKLSPDG